MPLYLLATGFTLWMAVEAVRNGHASRWLWIILLFGPLGAAVYFFSEYLGQGALTRVTFRPRKVSPADLRRVESEIKRLDNAAAWTEYASLLRARNEFAKAAEAAQRAVERSPKDLDARYELGLALLGADRFEEAAAALQAVVDQDRSYDTDSALFALSRAQQGTSDLAAARASLEELASRRSRPEMLYDLAVGQGLVGDGAAAAVSLQRIIDEAEVVPPYLQREVRPWVRKARRALARLSR
ncbi:MAG TPA: tetratricopeptide repeat protein [Vicinamibacteria bacterium]|nr:tetratricopeptide repeat protein [Vicinamibacteria bacterium]